MLKRSRTYRFLSASFDPEISQKPRRKLVGYCCLLYSQRFPEAAYIRAGQGWLGLAIAASRLLRHRSNDDLPLHAQVVQAAEMRTAEGERPGFVGSELDGGGVALLEQLVDVELAALETVIVVGGGDDQLNVLALLDFDDGGIELIFLRRHVNLARLGRRALGPQTRTSKRGEYKTTSCDSKSSTLHKAPFSLKS